MKVIKKIMCSLAIIGSLASLNNLAMEQAAHAFIGRIAETTGRLLNQGDLEYIHSMLASYPGLANTGLDDETTLLIKEIKLNNDEVVRLLLQDPDTDVNIADGQGNTPLHHLVSPPIGFEQYAALGEMMLKHRMESTIPLALGRGASPFARNAKGESVLDLVRYHYPPAYEYLIEYANYGKILYNAARKVNLRGVQYALLKWPGGINMKNNELLSRFGEIPPAEIGNTPFHAAILGALGRYERILPEIIRINESRNVGANKFLPARYFNNKIGELLAPIDNVIRLFKIHNPDTTIRNANGETASDLLIKKATTGYEKTVPMLSKILTEPREKSLRALRKAKIIE